MYIKHQREVGIIIISFKPGVIYHLFKSSLNTSTKNIFIDAEPLLKRKVSNLAENMSSAVNITEKHEIIRNFTIQLCNIVLSANDYFVRIIESIFNQNGVLSIENLAKDACISKRTLERKFIERIGVSPAFYSKIVRCHKLIELYKKSNLSWLDIVFEMKYFDQSHLIRDFKIITGETPTKYFKTSHPIEDILSG